MGLYTISDGVVSKVVDTSGPIARFLWNGAANISNDGTLSFLAQLDSGDYAIYRGIGQSLDMIADTSGVFSGFSDQPIVNSQGQIAFVAYLTSGGTGNFHRPRSGGRQDRRHRRRNRRRNAHRLDILGF